MKIQNKRSSISQSKRFFILTRDNFCCVYCGRSPKNSDVNLQIDHIVPVSEQINDSLDNLVTCCSECNIGKGKRLDFAKSIIGDINDPESVSISLWLYKKECIGRNILNRIIEKYESKYYSFPVFTMENIVSKLYYIKEFEPYETFIDMLIKGKSREQVVLDFEEWIENNLIELF